MFIIAQGDDTLNIDTHSNRTKFYGKVKIPEVANESRYIRWETVAADDDNLAHFDHLVKSGDVTLVFPGLYKEYKGASLTAYAINRVLPGWGSWMILIAAWLFAISTMISWSYYGEQCWAHLFGVKSILSYKALFLLFVWMGAIFQAEAVIDFGDMMILGMAFPNLIGVVMMSGSIKRELDDYLRRLRSGEMPRYG